MDTEKRTNSHQKLPKSSPKLFKIEGRHATFFARGGSGRLKTRIRTSTQAKRGEDTTAYTHFDRKSCQHGAKWASKIEPKSKENDARIDSKIDAFHDRFSNRFWWIFGAKMEACCIKIESKTCVLRKCEKRIWS